MMLVALASGNAGCGAQQTITESDPAACNRPLDAQTLGRLLISPFDSAELEVQPGRTLKLAVATQECCVFFKTVDACVTWSVTPSAGARIDAVTGELTVDAGTPHGSAYTVRADVEKGRRILSRSVFVYTPAGNPFKGLWREEAQLDCRRGNEVAPEVPIEELILTASGRFYVTWHPFEIRRDYWGTYAFDRETRAFDLTVESGNYIPADVRGGGRFSWDAADRLVLEDIWLGTPFRGEGPARCGHKFRRR
jgi:hypothetical protein